MPYRDEIKGLSKASSINLGKLAVISYSYFVIDQTFQDIVNAVFPMSFGTGHNIHLFSR